MPTSLPETLARVRRVVDDRLPGLLADPASGPDAAAVGDALPGAAREALLSPGKRVRPGLVFLVGELFGAPEERLPAPACAVEMIHAASLALDDLPSMDDATTRRGRPALHAVHGEDLAQADRNVVVLRRVIEYALAMEGMTLGLIQSLTMPGNETMAFKLPGFKETLRHFLHAIEQGKPVSVQRVGEPREGGKEWEVATLAAYPQARGGWFARLWKRINPVTIESAPRSAGWKLRGEAAEWWDLHKIAVRDLSPDLVNDQILQGVARLSKEELEKLRKTQRGEHS